MTAVVSSLMALAGIALIAVGILTEAMIPVGVGASLAVVGVGLFARALHSSRASPEEEKVRCLSAQAGAALMGP